MLRSVVLGVIAVGLLAGAAHAEPQHGVAMHGAPKYGPGFANLDYVNPDAPKGGDLRLAVTGSFDSVHPFIIKGRSAAGRQYVFESLLKRVWDEAFSLYGLIAETVEMPGDRSWVEFKLREGVHWADGTPITVDDVVFSMETLRDQGRPNHRLFYSKVASVERPGPRTVRFVFAADSDDRELPLIMGLMPILSKSYFEDVAFDETTLTPLMGSGPYRIASVDAGRSIVYERDPNYWGRDLAINRGQNNFDTVRYEYFRDTTALMEAFKSGDYDLRVESSAQRWATGYDFPAMRDGSVTLETLPNQRPSGMRGFVFNTRRDIFEDVRVREALGYAFDFEWTNKSLLQGAYTRTVSYFDNSELGSQGVPAGAELALLEPYRGQVPDSIFAAPFALPATDGSGNIRANLRSAQGLLRGAGWQVREGKLVGGADGAAMEFEILLVSPSYEKIALAYARNLERLGITANVRTVDSAQYQARRTDFDYDMIINRWGISLSPGNEQAFYWGTQAAGEPGSRNYMGVEDRVVDALIEKVTGAADRQGLVDAMRALDRVLLAGHYLIPLYHLKNDRVAYWDRLGHPEVTPVYGFVLETWWQDPAKAARLPR
jgi:ABC-type oligopeptide transport system substrate-binding subunit